MYPLLFMLIVHSCAAMPHYIGSPFARSVFGFPPAFEAWPSSFASFSNFPRFDSNWISDLRTPPIGPSFPTFAPAFQVPIIPITIPTIAVPAAPVNTAECQEVSDVKDLTYPPHSEIPTNDLKPEEILVNEVKKSTYLCKDSDKKEFYMLRTHAVFATINIRNTQDTANYYSLEKAPLTIGKELNISHGKIWEIIDELDKKKAAAKTTTAPAQPQTYTHQSLWSSLWSPFSIFDQAYPKPECKDHKLMENLEYPKIEVTAESVGDEIVDKTESHETQYCTDKTTNKQYYLLKTSVQIKTKKGATFHRFSTISHAADKDGNPLPRADGATSVVSNSYSSVTNGLPKTMSSYATYHHQ